jgi:hypothetical protein
MPEYKIKIGKKSSTFTIPEPKYDICDLVTGNVERFDLNLPCLCFLDTEGRTAVINYVISLTWTKEQYSLIRDSIHSAVELQQNCPSDLYKFVMWRLLWDSVVGSKVPEPIDKIKNDIDNDEYIKAYKKIVDKMDAKRKKHSH